MDNHREESQFLKGTLIGAILGGGAGLLLAPKSGKELRDNIVDGYTYLNEKTQGLTEQINTQGHKILHPFEKEKPCNSHSFLIGGIAGALVGAAISSLLAPQSGAKLRKTLEKTYEDVIGASEDILSNLDSKGRETTGEVMDWVHLGMKFLHQLQKRR
jgi:gas vesicle protein